MNEKYISGVGAGLILISFGIIISFLVASGVENEAMENNQTISFEQLGDFQNSYENLRNNPTSQEFRSFVGNTADELKDTALVIRNSTLYPEIKNSTVINGTE